MENLKILACDDSFAKPGVENEINYLISLQKN